MDASSVVPVVLSGRFVRLEPLTLAHQDALCDVGLDPDLWRWTTNCVANASDLQDYIETALAEQASGKSLPFVQIEVATGCIVGSTRFANIEPTHKRVEIGWTWLGRAWQRTAINTEAKYLLLHHAFERWGCNRVELKTDALNERSRRAIQRIGATEEGVLRHHVVTSVGRIRDSVYYSVLAGEWPEVKARLEQMIDRSDT